MNRLDSKTRRQIVASLVEGNSIRATSRMTGAAKGTILKLLAELGDACEIYQDDNVRGLSCKRVECDEIWSFCYAKDKNVPNHMRGDGVGSVWTWTALDADTKLIVSYFVGNRDASCAFHFMHDVAARIDNRIQLTTDGLRAYLYAVGAAFDGKIDYAMLVKLYGPEPAGAGRYSPPKCIGVEPDVITGEPDLDHISTSYVVSWSSVLERSRRRPQLDNRQVFPAVNIRHSQCKSLARSKPGCRPVSRSFIGSL